MRRKCKPNYRRTVLRLPDLDHSKLAVLNSLSSPASRRVYEYAIDQFIAWYCSEPRLAFNRIVVVRYRMHLESRGLAANTINQQLAAVRRLAHEAADSGLLSPELAAGISGVKGVKQLGFRSGNWLTVEQCSEVLKHASGRSLRAKRDYAMLAMLFGCGLRRSELVGLQLDEVQMRQGHWAIVDLIGKGGHIRTVPVPAWVKGALDDWATWAGIVHGRIFRAISRMGKVWGKGVSQNVVWYVVKTCCERAGLQHIAPHDLRRTCAKLCHSSGGELEQIQFLLGHASVQTTERYLGCKQNLGHPVNDLFELQPCGDSDNSIAQPAASTPLETISGQGLKFPHGGSEYADPHFLLESRTTFRPKGPVEELSDEMKPNSSADQQPPCEAKDLVVFDVLRDSKCADCGKDLLANEFLFMEGGRPLCLTCADLDHLVYLHRGDMALTRRARKHSTLSAVVVRFSRARKRYERQGVLVEETALEQAERECLADANERSAHRERAEQYRAKQDQAFAMRMAESIQRIFPGCPPEEAQLIAAHTSVRGSGRVGRTAAGQGLDEEALRAAVIAAIRHRHTTYDRLLMRGWERKDARYAVRDDIDRLLDQWRRS
jgi:site-specific recombinase XerD